VVGSAPGFFPTPDIDGAVLVPWGRLRFAMTTLPWVVIGMPYKFEVSTALQYTKGQLVGNPGQFLQ